MYLQIKERNRPFPSQRTGILLRPNLMGEVHCNEQLYQRIRGKGSAVILRHKADNPLEFEDYPVTLSAEEFEQQWKGD